MKNQTQTYTARIGDRDLTFIANSTKAAARATINETLSPCLVTVRVDGKVMYDAFPDGHPLAAGMTIIERCCLTASGYKWRPRAND